MRTYKYGIAGTGGKWGHGIRSHVIPGLQHGFELVGVYDPDAEMIEQAREKLGTDFKVFKKFKKMLADPTIEAVVITSPDRFHPRQLLAAVKAGKHVLCDKPMAISWWGMRLVRKAFRLARRRGLAIMSCHPRREDLPYSWVKANFEDMVQRFGALEHIELDFSYHTPYASWKAARSLLLDHFLHEIDFVLWIVGNLPFEVRRMIDGFDRYTVAGKVGQSITFLFNGSRRLKGSVYPETITLRFDRGTCMVNAQTGLITYRCHETEEIETILGLPINYDKRFSLIMASFAKAIETGFDASTAQHLLSINTAAVRLATKGYYKSMS